MKSSISSLRKGQRSSTPSRRPRGLTRLTRPEPPPAPARRPNGRRTPSLPCRLLSRDLWSPLLGAAAVGPTVALRVISQLLAALFWPLCRPQLHTTAACYYQWMYSYVGAGSCRSQPCVLSVTCHQTATSCLALFKWFLLIPARMRRKVQLDTRSQ